MVLDEHFLVRYCGHYMIYDTSGFVASEHRFYASTAMIIAGFSSGSARPLYSDSDCRVSRCHNESSTILPDTYTKSFGRNVATVHRHHCLAGLLSFVSRFRRNILWTTRIQRLFPIHSFVTSLTNTRMKWPNYALQRAAPCVAELGVDLVRKELIRDQEKSIKT